MCKKLEGKPYEAGSRVKETVVFANTGSFKKPFLDLVRSLSAVKCLRCLRRFSARRGTPSLIKSDNAKTFKATAKALKKLYSDEKLQGHLKENMIGVASLREWFNV